jgi:hypothetical protein
MQTAVVFVALTAAFVEVEADTGQHSDGTIHHPDDPGQGYFIGWDTKKIASSFSLLAVEDAFLPEFQQDIFQEFQGDLFGFGYFLDQYGTGGISPGHVFERAKGVLCFLI